jgi:hypothetical protein
MLCLHLHSKWRLSVIKSSEINSICLGTGKVLLFCARAAAEDCAVILKARIISSCQTAFADEWEFVHGAHVTQLLIRGCSRTTPARESQIITVIGNPRAQEPLTESVCICSLFCRTHTHGGVRALLKNRRSCWTKAWAQRYSSVVPREQRSMSFICMHWARRTYIYPSKMKEHASERERLGEALINRCDPRSCSPAQIKHANSLFRTPANVQLISGCDSLTRALCFLTENAQTSREINQQTLNILYWKRSQQNNNVSRNVTHLKIKTHAIWNWKICLDANITIWLNVGDPKSYQV